MSANRDTVTLKKPMAIAAEESARYSLFDLCCSDIDIEGISKREPAGMVSDQTELCFGINKTTFIDAATQTGSDFLRVAGKVTRIHRTCPPVL